MNRGTKKKTINSYEYYYQNPITNKLFDFFMRDINRYKKSSRISKYENNYLRDKIIV